MTISQNPAVLRGKPVISGTRISVSLILNLLANGYTFERVTEAYPQLTIENVRECLAFASLRMENEEVYDLTGISPF
ncbi:MAG: DUF433 domain-containing protein [Caldilineaceae bacterium]|nr:DUF433 domain-containing protein [Caldilineaceae bacterium]HRJ42328.1 DUF433 domain-containing protein [Caldilineaceae bacterium]